MNDSTISLSRDELKEIIAEHVHKLEVGETALLCLCEWTKLDDGRRIRGAVNMECPVHTKEGMILHFLTHAKLDLADKVPAGRTVTRIQEGAMVRWVEDKPRDVDGESW